MLKYKESKTNLPKDTYELNFKGWYGDMDYRYDKTHSVPKTPENEEIIDSILKIVGTKEITDEDTTIEINELLEQLSPDFYISRDMNEYFPNWNLIVTYYNEIGQKFDVSYCDVEQD